jgi:hypothetical protein
MPTNEDERNKKKLSLRQHRDNGLGTHRDGSDLILRVHKTVIQQQVRGREVDAVRIKYFFPWVVGLVRKEHRSITRHIILEHAALTSAGAVVYAVSPGHESQDIGPKELVVRGDPKFSVLVYVWHLRAVVACRNRAIQCALNLTAECLPPGQVMLTSQGTRARIFTSNRARRSQNSKLALLGYMFAVLSCIRHLHAQLSPAGTEPLA